MQFKRVLEVAQKLLFRHFKCDLLIADWLAEPNVSSFILV